MKPVTPPSAEIYLFYIYKNIIGVHGRPCDKKREKKLAVPGEAFQII